MGVITYARYVKIVSAVVVQHHSRLVFFDDVHDMDVESDRLCINTGRSYERIVFKFQQGNIVGWK